MKRAIILILSITSATALAQTTDELLKFSQNNFGISTARSAAMGGAFTSLGADASAMSINPAGLGMYRRGELSFTPQLRLNNTRAGYALPGTGNTSTTNNTGNKLVMSNFGAVYTQDNFIFGVGYNRLADYYSRYSVTGTDQRQSITDMFAQQIINSGIKPGSLDQGNGNYYDVFYNYPPSMWGAIMAYRSDAVYYSDTDKTYYSALDYDATVSPLMSRKTEGALDEFTFSAAYNLDDLFYIGATLGAQSLVYNKFDSYSEWDPYASDESLTEVVHNRTLRLRGDGFNIKVGAIARPMPWLRLGLAYHSPTWMNVTQEYDEVMYSYFQNSVLGDGDSDTPYLRVPYDATTPSRLLAGASFTIASRAILSFDFKRTWHGHGRYRGSFYEGDYRPELTATDIDNYHNLSDNMTGRNVNLNPLIRQNYRAVNNLSVGAEVNVIEGLFVRGGYSYQDSPYSEKALQDYGALSQLSAGLGYRTPRISIDAAYVHSKSDNLPYNLYSYDNFHSDGRVVAQDVIQNLILTIGFRF